MLFLNSPTQDKYSRPLFLLFAPAHFFSKPSQKHPKTSPNHSQTHPKTSPNWRKSDPEMTPKWPSGSRESNRRPPDSRSEDQPTRVFWPHKTAPLRVPYVSKIQSLCVKFPACAHAHSSSAGKIARTGSFRSQRREIHCFRVQRTLDSLPKDPNRKKSLLRAIKTA